MKLAVNYSPEAAELLQEHAVDIDFFKCADWPEIIEPARALRPIYVHFPLRAGRMAKGPPDLSTIDRWKEETKTTYVNVHLQVTAGDLPDTPYDDRSPATLAKVAALMETDIRRIADHVGDPALIIAENLPTQPNQEEDDKPLCAAVDPDLIRGVLERTGCNLLLDIDHARVAAETLGMTLESYIAKLPTGRLRELHMTGVETLPSGERCDHMAMTDEDWRIFTWTIDQIAAGRWGKPWVYAFEYGGIGPLFAWRSKREVLASHLPRMRMMLEERGLLAD